MGQIKNVLNMVRNANDPAAALSSLMANNPQYNQALQLIQQSGGDAKKAFYDLAQRNGINPDDILNALK